MASAAPDIRRRVFASGNGSLLYVLAVLRPGGLVQGPAAIDSAAITFWYDIHWHASRFMSYSTPGHHGALPIIAGDMSKLRICGWQPITPTVGYSGIGRSLLRQDHFEAGATDSATAIILRR